MLIFESSMLKARFSFLTANCAFDKFKNASAVASISLKSLTTLPDKSSIPVDACKALSLISDNNSGKFSLPSLENKAVKPFPKLTTKFKRPFNLFTTFSFIKLDRSIMPCFGSSVNFIIASTAKLIKSTNSENKPLKIAPPLSK